jgi:hypothetical protein
MSRSGGAEATCSGCRQLGGGDQARNSIQVTGRGEPVDSVWHCAPARKVAKEGPAKTEVACRAV